MRRRILGVVLAMTLLLSFLGFAAEAATFVDTQAPGSLQLTYSYDGQAFGQIPVRIYHVAEIDAYATFTLAGGFEELPVELNQVKTQEEWRQVASTLAAYVTALDIAPSAQALTDENGMVQFAQLPLGLYLVEGVRAEREDGYCQFDSFVISVPDLDEADAWVYDVVAKPKSVFQQILPQEITYTVNKLWKDEGHAHLRPQSITLELYRDGELVETVTLSAENNWTYSWTTQDDGAVWQVVEANVPDGYTVTMEQREAHFFVTNSYDEPVPPPETGDISGTSVYLLMMVGAGLGLIVLGLTARKGKKA